MAFLGRTSDEAARPVTDKAGRKTVQCHEHTATVARVGSVLWLEFEEQYEGQRSGLSKTRGSVAIVC